MGRRLLPFLPAVLWAMAVWTIGGLSATPSAPTGLGLDKAGHFAMYGVLGYLLGFGWVRARPGVGRMWFLAFALLLGLGDELRQARMPDRSAEFADWLADAAGAATGFFIAVRLTRRPRPNHGTHERT